MEYIKENVIELAKTKGVFRKDIKTTVIGMFKINYVRRIGRMCPDNWPDVNIIKFNSILIKDMNENQLLKTLNELLKQI